jgi:hypothetical protein
MKSNLVKENPIKDVHNLFKKIVGLVEELLMELHKKHEESSRCFE